jgi:eukaryotic-like serine/threonine-protein kinase
MIGKAIAHFEIEGQLGAGGMGEVYRARDTRLGRSVAVKMLPAAFAGDPERVARFEREAKLLAALNHANIAALYGIEQSAGQHFLIMELVEGDTLAERIARGPVPVSDALNIVHQIAEALEAAHEKGIVHRDLKPANVKITPDGKVKVLDFGLAKALEETSLGAGGVNTHSPTLSIMATGAGMILGTAGYMSPEQARGHATDARSDIFSFACVFYEMLTGRRTFQGETITDVIASIVARDPDWRAIPANLNPRIEELIRRCLAKNRKDRWHAIADVRVEIEAIIADPHGLKLAAARETPRPPLWRRALPATIAALVVAAISVGAVIAVMNSRQAPAASITRFPVVLPDGQRFLNNARGFVTISPDGGTIVYAADGQLYSRNMTDMEVRPIPGTSQNASRPFFSPDGKWLAYVSRAEAKLKRIAITGGAAVNIADFDEVNSGFGPVWNADDFIYVGQPGAIARVPASGGTFDKFIALKENEVGHRPQLLPGGNALLFTVAADNQWDNAQVVVQSLASGERKTLISGGSDGRYVPTGHIVYALGADILAVHFDVTSLTVSDGPVPVLEGVRRAAPAGRGGADAQFAFANNGTMVYMPGGEASRAELALVMVDRSGTRKPLNIPPGAYSTPRVSPDGKLLAVATDDGREQVVWIADLTDATPIRKLTFEGRNRRPLWTKDGQRVVYHSERGNEQGIFWQRIDGGVPERLVTLEPGVSAQSEGWSADGKTLVFTNRTGVGGRLGSGGISMVSAASGQKPERVVPPPATNSSLSPDGRWLAYTAPNEAGRQQVYVQPFPPTGEKHQVTTQGGGSPLWSPGGRELFFMQPIRDEAGTVTAGGPPQLASVEIRTDPGFVFGKVMPLPIEGFVGDGPRPYDVTPDGKAFVMMVPKTSATPERPQAEQINVTLNWFEELKQRVPVK